MKLIWFRRCVLRHAALRLIWFAGAAFVTMTGPSSAHLYAQQSPWITGYYSAQNGNLPVSQIPWAKYTHVIHFAASTDGAGHIIPYYLTQAEINLITTSHPPGTKVLVSIKDNDNNLNNFPNSTAVGTIDGFVTSIVNFVVNNGYDGVDLDWEKNVNVTQYDSLLSKLRAALPASKIIALVANPNTVPVAIDSRRYSIRSMSCVMTWIGAAPYPGMLTRCGMAPTAIRPVTGTSENSQRRI
jgi:GH18 family chitinase